MDHSSIYYLIAGSYTPLLFIVVKWPLGWTLFGIMWGLAIAGTVFKAYFVKRFLHTSTILYVVMGWLIVFAWKPLITNMSTEGLVLLALGGLLYTGGAVFYVWRGFPYHHAVWHVFVLVAAILVFFAIMTLLPIPA